MKKRRILTALTSLILLLAICTNLAACGTTVEAASLSDGITPRYVEALSDIKADKDEDGKSITGSRKEKVIDYVNSLDIDYGMRIIIFKSEYKADDSYNQDIVDYLNERDDISGAEMKSILLELGFEVDDDGNIYW